MARLEILHFPDPRLRTVAADVTTVNANIRQLVDDMFETMYAAPGIGLAATQINVHRRIIVIDISEKHDEPLVLINPSFEVLGPAQQLEEGCLSVPGVFESVQRSERIRVCALDRDGTPWEREVDGLLAQCIQHECDHLEGKLFVDYLSALKRQRIRRRLEKQQRQRA